MTFKEWLDLQCKNRAERLNAGGELIKNFKFPALQFNNGHSMSVQASEYHACEPRETLMENEYKSVEVLGEAPQLMFWDSDGLVRRYVLVEVMEEIAKANGGIKYDSDQQ